MKQKKVSAILWKLFAGIFTGIMGLLAVLAIFWHCETNLFDYAQSKSVVRHTPWLYCGLALLAAGGAAVLCALLNRIFFRAKEERRAARGIFLACGAVLALAGLVWILFYDSVPAYDQKDVWEEALRIAGAAEEPFDTDYFSFFHRNRGLVLVEAALIKIFGESYFPFRLLNVFAVLLAYGCICGMAELVYKNRVITALTSILLALFFPLVVYTSYCYGTLLSVSFTCLGLYLAALFGEKGRLRDGAGMAAAFALGVMMHQSAAIGLVAAVIYLAASGCAAEGKKKLFICLLSGALIFASGEAVDAIYEGITGTSPEADAVPAACTVYMGITATEGDAGPGSQDGSYTEIYVQNGRDAKRAGQAAVSGIVTVLREYAAGERELSFFLEKIQYQWLDPTLGARKTIRTNDIAAGEPENADYFLAFYSSPLRSIVFKLAVGAMLAVYLGAFAAGIQTLGRGRTRPQAVLVQLYAVGGFVFQLFWESLSRYCFGYYLWLIPEAAVGGWLLYCVCRRAASAGVSKSLSNIA